LEGGVRKPPLPSNPLDALDVERLLDALQTEKRKREGGSMEAESEHKPETPKPDSPAERQKSESPDLTSRTPPEMQASQSPDLKNVELEDAEHSAEAEPMVIGE